MCVYIYLYSTYMSVYIYSHASIAYLQKYSENYKWISQDEPTVRDIDFFYVMGKNNLGIGWVFPLCLIYWNIIESDNIWKMFKTKFSGKYQGLLKEMKTLILITLVKKTCLRSSGH